MEILLLELAGARLRFDLTGFTCLPALRERYASFLREDAATHSSNGAAETVTRLDAMHGMPPDIGDFRTTLPGSLARFRREDISVNEMPDGHFAGRVEDGPFSFDMLLRGLVNLACARKGRLLLHAAGFVENGHAVVHPGLESAGKSTLSRRRLAEGAILLSDELVVVDPAHRVACGTPFMGECPDPRPRGFFPLARVEVIRGWGCDKSCPLTPLAALRVLAPLVVNYGPASELSNHFYAALVSLVERVEIREMFFTA